MKKKLITLLALVAIVSGFAMAAPQTVVADNTAGAYSGATTDVTVSTSNSGDNATVVADAKNKDFLFELQALNGDLVTWTSVDGKDVYDTAWNVRDGFVASFRVLTKEGSQYSAQSVLITITPAPLKLVADNNIVSSTPTITDTSIGSNFGSTSAFSSDVFTLITKPNTYYGGTANDAVEFNLTFAPDSVAPAGRYESLLTVAYTAS